MIDEVKETGPQARYSVIADVMSAELHAGSGVVCEDTGRELTNLEIIRDVAKALGASGILLSSNGLSSSRAKRHNSELLSSNLSPSERADCFMLTVVGVYPPESSNV